MTEAHKRLYQTLIETELNCVPAGHYDTADVYKNVESEYPELCDDNILCRDVCGASNNQPEWKHRVRTVQQDLKRDPDSRVTQLNGDWFYHPVGADIQPIPDDGQFEVGAKYNRWHLHDVFGGQRYTGISTPASEPFVFIFTGDSGKEYGYEDEFLPDDTFLYTGEGVDGDMAMEGGNRAIHEHKSEREEIHLFEDTEYPWIVTYVGQFEYEDHQWDTLPDKSGKRRNAIRFRLQPVGGTEVQLEEGSPSSISMDRLFEKAKEHSPTSTGETSSSGGDASSRSGRSYKRSEVVKEFALRDADGVCQGCGEDAPFEDKSGKPFLEVHHLHRRSDGGADDPENVIAVCPNCHRRIHHGNDGESFNRELIEKAEERNQRFESLLR